MCSSKLLYIKTILLFLIYRIAHLFKPFHGFSILGLEAKTIQGSSLFLEAKKLHIFYVLFQMFFQKCT
jgi:hypothetical protein